MKKVPFDSNTQTDLTPEEITELKKEYGDVFCIEVEDKKAFIHKPSRQILDLASSSSSKKASQFNEVILKNCWLAGDKDIVHNDDYFLGASAVLDEVITFKKAELKKL